ncbi:MAG TPA: carbohydrate ABC transporter permease [Actinomycetota bacterium]|nr:carbohydrate ABC transporter permease [Actinomycetota bacterium]
MNSTARRVFRVLGALLLCAVFLSPLVLMALGSLRAPGLPPPDGFELAPRGATMSNYETVFAFVPLGRYLMNSLLIAIVAVPVTVVIASWTGYAIVAAAPRARRWLIGVCVVTLMVPLSALWVPRFVLFRWMGLLDTLWPLMAPALMATTPFYVLLFALTYARIPRELFDAARLQNLSPMAIWRRVAWPLGRPTVFAVAVLAFAWHWANFVDPLLYLSSGDLYTAPLGLRALQALEPTNHSILLAACVMVCLPGVAAFVAAQRSFFDKTLEV